MLKLRKNKKGFTLVELIVVIAIMAVLAGTVAGVTVSQLNKAKNDNAVSDIKNLFNEFETFMASNPNLVEAITVAKNANDQSLAAQALVNAFNNEKKAAKGLNDNILTLKAENTPIPKAGTGKYVYTATFADGKLTLTIECAKVGSTGADPTGTRTYEI